MAERAWLIAAGALLLAGCGNGGEGGEASSNFVPPVTLAPEPLPGQAQTTPLTAYIGHYPRDAVEGVSFFDRSDVAQVLVDLVPEERTRRLIVSRESTETPIFRTGSRIAAHGCEAHNCDGHNWTVMVAANGDRDLAAVCLHQAAMGNASRWTTRAGTSQRPGGCPSA